MDRRQFALGLGALSLLPRAQAQPQQGVYSWNTVPFGAGGFVDGFVFHPRQPGLLYARTDIGGAYRFEPKTQSWTPLMDHLGKADGDLMGVGFYELLLSSQAKDDLLGLHDENGVELFYNLRIKPGCHLTPDLQVIQPGLAPLETAILFGLRLKLDF